jgi:hypothetical protein
VQPTVTDQDLKVYRFVAAFWFAHARGPTLREISEGMGWSAHGTAQRHVDALLRVGHLARDATGQLMTPGQGEVTPCLAVVVGGDGDEWIAAPAPNLIAWRVRGRGPGVRPDEVVFAAAGSVAKVGELVLLRSGDTYRVAVLEASPERRRRPAYDRAMQGDELVDVVGPVRYLLRKIPRKE